MSTPRYFTSSEIKLWQQCRRKWYVSHFLQYGPKQDPGDVSVMRTGNLFAQGAELYYRGELETTEEILDAIRAEADANAEALAADGQEHRVPTLRKNAELVDIMLSGFIEWLEESGVDSDLDIVSAEEEISVEHPEIPGVFLLGKTDQRAVRRSTGRRLLMDNKTVQSAEDQQKKAPLNPQFKHYALIEILREPELPPVEAALIRWARRVKRTARSTPPFYGEVSVPLPREVLRSYYRQSTGLIREILRAEERLRDGESEDYVCGPTASDACGYCPFRAPCLLFDSNTESATDVLRWSYEKRNPLARYAGGDSEDGEA